MTRTTISSNRKELEDPNIPKKKKKVQEFKFKIENEVCLNFPKAFQNCRKHNIEEIHQPIAQLSFFHSLFHLYAKHLITKESLFKIILEIRLKIK